MRSEKRKHTDRNLLSGFNWDRACTCSFMRTNCPGVVHPGSLTEFVGLHLVILEEASTVIDNGRIL